MTHIELFAQSSTRIADFLLSSLSPMSSLAMHIDADSMPEQMAAATLLNDRLKVITDLVEAFQLTPTMDRAEAFTAKVNEFLEQYKEVAVS